MKKKAIPLVLAFVFCLLLPLPARATRRSRRSFRWWSSTRPRAWSFPWCSPGRARRSLCRRKPPAWPGRGTTCFGPSTFLVSGRGAAPPGHGCGFAGGDAGGKLHPPAGHPFLNQDTGAYYNNLCVLDLQSRTLTAGQPWWRQPLLVFLRVALTLLLEGIVFFLFGYRQKRSWILFFLANGLTQLLSTCSYSTLWAPWGTYTPPSWLSGSCTCPWNPGDSPGAVPVLPHAQGKETVERRPLHHSGQPVQLVPGRRAAGLSAHLTGRRVSQ